MSNHVPMPLEAAFDKRTNYLFHSMKSRFGERAYKTGKRKGQVFRPAIPIPYSMETFRQFVLQCLGGNKNGSTFCHYCSTVLDAMNIGFDHEMPIAQGGTTELINLKPCCSDCNTFKGKLSPMGFAWLKQQLVYQTGKALTITDAQDIVSRLKSGGGFFKIRQALNATKAAAKKKEQEAF